MTIGKWLKSLADSDTSTEADATRMTNLLRRIGFPKAICVLGIVYTEGKGTVEFPPISIHSMAKALPADIK